jgi:protein-tyrosine kinase
MTRVSDALARAAQAGTSSVPPPQPAEPVTPHGGDDIWPVEAPALPQTPAEERRRQEISPSAAAVAHEPVRGDDKLVTQATVTAAPIEQYRRLAARLHLAQAEAGTRTVMITSAIVGEGKTLTAANLALTLSESYKRRVLLIDADLRRPWVHELFRVPNLTGLNDGVRGDTDRKVPLIAVSEYLSVLTGGRPDPDPMSVLTSDRMRRILADAARSFEWVIVDTPPVALLSDAHLLARLVDTVVMVVKAGSTQHSAMVRAIEAIGRDRILGVVLNCVDETYHERYGYYGYASRVGETATL